ncbi:uncharacterized protein LOC120355712 [Nilaparvata lugens]|uniref:uncharacterized protein LOC120355712 n=2 Tax=Nilaparvata lugens TaxID=108931 RepID=UPI000B999FFE|nr:uncharacterized protein LOC120355712 [Nilaparvata lugens]
MVALKTCWSPCIWNPNVTSGSYCCAAYTIAAGVVFITFTIYMMLGGDSTQIYLPLFETDVNGSMQFYGWVFILYFLMLIAFSVMLVLGIRRTHRGLMLPWMIAMAVAVGFQFLFSLWLCYGYYIYISILVPALMNWIWMSYNIYCWLCVYSQYKIIYELQTPNIELLYP